MKLVRNAFGCFATQNFHQMVSVTEFSALSNKLEILPGIEKVKQECLLEAGELPLVPRCISSNCGGNVS